MPKVKLKANVVHGMTTRKAGEVVDMEDAHAQSLIKRGLAEPHDEKKKEPEKKDS